MAQQAFDIIVTDLSGDSSSWAKTADEIRAVAGPWPVTLIAAVDIIADTTREQLKRAGFDDLLQKPLTGQALLDLVNAVSPAETQEKTMPLAMAAPQGAWPAKLARATATRIYSATEMGDVAGLFQIAEELSEVPGLAAREVEQLAAMARDFDFDGLRRFAAHLQSQA
jgi:CheY-like chemotaxis protein